MAVYRYKGRGRDKKKKKGDEKGKEIGQVAAVGAPLIHQKGKRGSIIKKCGEKE